MGSDNDSTDEMSGKGAEGAAQGDPMAEFMTAADALSAGMSEVFSNALRLQMLMLEDAQSMMAELSEFADAAGNAEPDESPDENPSENKDE